MRRTGTPGVRYGGQSGADVANQATRTAKRTIAPGQPPRAHELPGVKPGGILPKPPPITGRFNNPGRPAPRRYPGSDTPMPNLPGRPSSNRRRV